MKRKYYKSRHGTIYRNNLDKSKKEPFEFWSTDWGDPKFNKGWILLEPFEPLTEITEEEAFLEIL